MGQAHHAAEAVGVRLDMGDERDQAGVLQFGQETVGSTGGGRSPVHTGIGTLPWHKGLVKNEGTGTLLGANPSHRTAPPSSRCCMSIHTHDVSGGPGSARKLSSP